MSPAGVMVGGSAASWLLVAAVLGRKAGYDVLVGMLGPLIAAGATWMLTERTFRRRPETLSSVMMVAFVVKLIFFGLYVVGAVRLLAVRPAPFAASFTSYFIGLYAVEALYLRRLFAAHGTEK